MRRIHLERALLPTGVEEAVSLTLDEAGTIVALGEADPALTLPGLALPGLINAHVHLDLAGPCVPAEGLPDWVRALPRPSAADARVQQALDAGTAGVVEVTNTCGAAEALNASPLAAVVHHEVLGIDADQLPATHGTRPSPHAPYSTSAALIQAACAVGGPMATIHCDEDPAERDFLLRGNGAWSVFITQIGRDLSAFTAPGCTPVQYLDRLGVLGPELALVHCTLTRDDDLDLIAQSGATVVLCPRSNLHISGALPDVPGMVRRGIPLAIGTDSLASCPDLDLLKDVAVLTEAFPQIDPLVFLHAATAGGARVLGRDDLGHIAVGARPGIWSVHTRGWLAAPGGLPC